MWPGPRGLGDLAWVLEVYYYHQCDCNYSWVGIIGHGADVRVITREGRPSVGSGVVFKGLSVEVLGESPTLCAIFFVEMQYISYSKSAATYHFAFYIYIMYNIRLRSTWCQGFRV